MKANERVGIFRAGNLKILRFLHRSQGSLPSSMKLYIAIVLQSFCCRRGRATAKIGVGRQAAAAAASPRIANASFATLGFQGFEGKKKKRGDQNFTALQTRGESHLNSCYSNNYDAPRFYFILLREEETGHWMERIIANSCVLATFRGGKYITRNVSSA